MRDGKRAAPAGFTFKNRSGGSNPSVNDEMAI
jgi:hypothetical protein